MSATQSNEELRNQAERLQRQVQEARDQDVGHARAIHGGNTKGSLAGRGGVPTGIREPTNPPAATAGDASTPSVAASAFNTGTTAVTGQPPLPEHLTRKVPPSEEEIAYHQPYKRDIHHGEELFPGVKGHEEEIYEGVEGYASPDDVSPEVKERVEKYGSTAEKDFEKEQHRGGAGKSAKSEEEISRSKPTTETTPTSPPSSSKKSPPAHEQVTAAAGELRDQAAATAASLTHHTEGLYVQAKEAVAQAARVTVERMAHVVEAAKEKVGIPKDKPLAVAAKEAVGIAPENPVREAAREATTSMTETAKEKAGEAVQGVRRVTVEELHGVTDRVVQVPNQMKEFYQHGRALAEEKDRAMMAKEKTPAEQQHKAIHPSYAPEFTLPLNTDQIDQSGGSSSSGAVMEKKHSISKGTDVEGSTEEMKGGGERPNHPTLVRRRG